MNRFSILISSLFLIIPCTTREQDISQTFDFAREQLNTGNTEEAIGLFRRVLFFDSSGVFSYEACKNLTSCYISVGDYDRAGVFSRIAVNLAPDDSLRNEQIFQIAYLRLMNNEPDYALIELYGVDDSVSGYFQNKKNFYLGIAFFQKRNYQKSIGCFFSCTGSNETEYPSELTGILKEINHIEKRYNPKTARILSIFVPGSGQIYCGDFRGAVNSVALTACLVVLFINTAANYSFIDASVSVLPWFQRYYQGGYQNAEKAALMRRQKRINIQYHKILTVIDQQ